MTVVYLPLAILLSFSYDILVAIGQVVGKGGRNIVTLQEECLPAQIDFDAKTGVMHIWGNSEKVEGVCDKVAKVTNMVQNTLKQHNQKIQKKSNVNKEKKVTNHNAKKKSHVAVDAKQKGKNKDKKTTDKQNRESKETALAGRRKLRKASAAR